jgi:uncharacterized protein YrrD
VPASNIAQPLWVFPFERRGSVERKIHQQAGDECSVIRCGVSSVIQRNWREAAMTDIPLGAEVECAGNICGRVTRAIISPAAQRVTHLIVREKSLHRTERLVPFDQVLHTTRDLISVGCTRRELASFKPFIETLYVQAQDPRNRDYPTPSSLFAPPRGDLWLTVRHERIPSGELAVRHGTPVRASDGRVGRVEKLLVDSASGHLTQLVLREGHLWAHRDAAVPVSNISCIGERAVFLNLDRRSVKSLPAIPAK